MPKENEVNNHPKVDNMDLRVLSEILEGMTPIQRREWFVKIKMAEMGKTFHEIAKKHRISVWFLSAVVRGKYPMSARACEVLEGDLKIDLRPFMGHHEAVKAMKEKPDMREVDL